MFCPECGSKNPEEAAFCQECGTKLESTVISSSPAVQKNINLPMQNDYDQSISMNPHKPMDKLSKIILCEVLILCLTIICAYNFGKQIYSPEKSAERHFLKVMNGDWEGVYKDFDIDKSDSFLSKKDFVKAQKYQGATEYNAYQVGQSKLDSENLGTSVDIYYRIKGSQENQEYYIAFNRQASKNYMLFDKWKVDPSPYICYNYMITVPKEVKVMFDDVELSSKYISYDEDDGYITYEIPELFQGKYSLKLTQENMEDINTTVSTYDGSYSISQMKLKEDVQIEVIKEAGNALKAIYNAGLSAAPFSEISDMFSQDEDTRSDLENSYSSFLSNFGQDNNTGLKKVDFSNLLGEASYGILDNGKLYVNVAINYDYMASYNEEDWYGKITTNTYSDFGSNQFTYVYENGDWLLSYADFNAVYYYY